MAKLWNPLPEEFWRVINFWAQTGKVAPLNFKCYENDEWHLLARNADNSGWNYGEASNIWALNFIDSSVWYRYTLVKS